MAQIKCRARVAERGEVFTNEREVNAMLDMVRGTAENGDKRILEPACGEGAFLREILRRRLEKLAAGYKKSQTDYEFRALMAVGGIYGIDIFEDNAETCRAALLEQFSDAYKRLFGGRAKQACINAAEFILAHNIVWGDSLTMKTRGGAGAAIVFPRWTSPAPYKIQKQDYIFEDLDKGILHHSDTGAKVIIPEPKGAGEIRPYLEWGQSDEPAGEAETELAGQGELFRRPQRSGAEYGKEGAGKWGSGGI